MKRELTLLSKKAKVIVWHILPFFLMGVFTMLSPEIASASNPCCVVPHDTQIGCDDLPYDFDPYSKEQRDELFGAAGWHGNCNYYYFTELSPQINLNNCDVGTIVRRFEVTDNDHYNPTTTICTQTIYVNAVHDYEIKFPADAIAYCSTPDPDPIEYNEIGCDLLAVSTTDMVFNTGVNACYKIFRKYRVINWCEYDGESPAIVIGRDEDCDGLPGDEPVWVLRRANDIIYTDRTSIQFDNSPSYSELNTYCGHDGQAGYWRSLPVYENAPNQYTGGFYEYTQHIKVTDDVDPELAVTTPDPFCSLSSDFANGCPGDVTVPFTVIEDCTDQATVKLFVFMYNVPVPLNAANDQFDELVSGSYPNYVINARLPIGVHSFEIHVDDGCGNSNSELVEVRVVDCKAPAPVCAHGLSTSLMPLEPNTDADLDGDFDEGAVEIWATDFVFSPVYDCSGPVSYSINFAGETPNRYQSNLVITCEDGDSVLVEVYAWDNAYNPYAIQPNGIAGGPNYDHCNTYIRITDNLGLCPGTPPIPTLATLEGAIYTELGSMVEEVAVYLDSDNPDMMMTQVDGHFSFEDLDSEYNYEIIPLRDGDDLNGLSTSDLVILAKHLMGITPLESPYLRIAADVDNDGDIDMDDFINLRNVILEVDPEFMNNTSWRFIDEDHVFSDEENPWVDNFSESIMLEDLENDELNLDFIAVKIGDLSANAILGHEGYVGFNTEVEPLQIEVQDQLLVAGQSYTVEIALNRLENITGYQFGLDLDPRYVALESVTDGLSEEQHINIKENANIRTSWDYFSANTVPVDYKEDVRIYTLQFTVTSTIYLSEVLDIEKEVLLPEAYDVAGQVQDIKLVFLEEARIAEGVQMQPMWPNPFKAFTYLSFFLPEAGEATISVISVNGTVVKQITADYPAGNNFVQLNLEDNLGSGVFYFNLKSGDFNETQRLIRIK